LVKKKKKRQVKERHRKKGNFRAIVLVREPGPTEKKNRAERGGDRVEKKGNVSQRGESVRRVNTERKKGHRGFTQGEKLAYDAAKKGGGGKKGYCLSFKRSTRRSSIFRVKKKCKLSGEDTRTREIFGSFLKRNSTRK